ncbi:MAG: oligosaccharide flippase family protein [Lachnospiraceae bacterium]|nr:oligosaccharide flippase family protein [Lachnospiraceae bacterium]
MGRDREVTDTLTGCVLIFESWQDVEGQMSRNDDVDRKAGKAGLWYTIANVLLKGCVFLSLPIFTRLMATGDFGIYNSYIAYEQLLQAVLGLGLYGTVKNAKLDFEEDFERYLSSVLSLSLIVLAVVLTSANILYGIYGEMIGFSRFVVNCLILQSFGAYLVFFYGSKLNIEFRYKSYIVISCFNTLVNIAASIILIIWVFPNERYLGRILGSALPMIIIALVLSASILRRGRVVYEAQYWKYALSIGLPLIPHVVSQSLLSQFDRIMIRNMISDASSGIYSYIYTICTITFIICTSLDNAWTPWVYIKLKAGDERTIRTAGKWYTILFAVLTLGFICVMPELVKLIADESYWAGEDLLVPLALANYCVFLYMLPVGLEYYHKKTKFISIGTISAALLNLVLNYFAILAFGYKAAAYTTLASYLALFFFHLLIARRLGFGRLYDIRWITAVTALLFAASFGILTLYGKGFADVAVRYAVAFVLLILIFKERRRLVVIAGRG